MRQRSPERYPRGRTIDLASWIEVWARIKRGNAYDAKGERSRAVGEYNKAVQSGINYDNAQTVAKKYLAAPFDPKAQTAEAYSPGF